MVPKRMEALRLKLEPEMKAVAQGVGISTRSTNEVPGLRPEENSEAEFPGPACSWRQRHPCGVLLH